MKLKFIILIMVFTVFASCKNKGMIDNKLYHTIEKIDSKKSYYLIDAPDTLMKNEQYHFKIYYNFKEISSEKYNLGKNRFPFLYLSKNNSQNIIYDTIVSDKLNRFDFIHSFNQKGKQKFSGIIEEQIYSVNINDSIRISKFEMNVEKEFYILN